MVVVIVMVLVLGMAIVAVQFGSNIGSVDLKAKPNGFELKVSRVKPAIEPPDEDPGS